MLCTGWPQIAYTPPRMLYDFHKTQNDRRPGAVHATYLVHGAKKATGHLKGGDGDVDMAYSSPDNESIAEGMPVLTLSLVPEDQLNGVHP
jgi:DNA polymerase delta subunit 3